MLLRADGVVVSHLFPAANIGMTALSVATVVILGAFIPRVETKMVPTMTTMARTNETHHGTPSNMLSNLCPGRVRLRAIRVRVAGIVAGGGGKDTMIAAMFYS